ncbi:hypothetical protein OG432_02945 [Streptomyces sp. NBC_00442]|uniref:MarR family winged helix-turn-helix transcriptional regulator n=1 Tax=Streptomyces sp. NBC_00442 TaxID=2903651 RepID=UPI002E1B1210
MRHQSQSRTVKDWESLGFGARREDPQDRRGFLVTLTQEGRAALDKDRKAGRDWVAQAVDALPSPDEQIQLAALPHLLDRLSDYGDRRG